MIVMPGFISTHNHQYEAIQRSIIADGLIVVRSMRASSATPTTNAVYEDYGTVVQNIWTSGASAPRALLNGTSAVHPTIPRTATTPSSSPA